MLGDSRPRTSLGIDHMNNYYRLRPYAPDTGSTAWTDALYAEPAFPHAGVGNFLFADGHVEGRPIGKVPSAAGDPGDASWVGVTSFWNMNNNANDSYFPGM